MKGSRVPNSAQINGMLQQLVLSLNNGQMDPTQLVGLTDEQLLLLVASGRYGTFNEQFELPDDADPNTIQADYERGVLTVSIRKQRLSYDRLFPQQRGFDSPLSDPMFVPRRGYGLPQGTYPGGRGASGGLGSSGGLGRGLGGLDSLFW